MASRKIIDTKQFELAIERLCFQLIEDHRDLSNTVIIGVQPRGVYLADRIYRRLKELFQESKVVFGKVDITFYRDDFRTAEGGIRKPLITDIPVSLEGKRIVLVDDVLYTGRTIRAAIDALMDFGRPKDIELMVLVDRRLHRHLPIQAKYIGKTVDSIHEERVNVKWQEDNEPDEVWIESPNEQAS